VLFNSYQFILLFLPITLFICFFIAHRGRADLAQFWLIVASLFFYATWNWRYLPLLLGSITANYVVAQAIRRSDSEKTRSRLLILAAVFNLSLLCYYKYTDFFLTTSNDVAGTHFSIQHIILPLGISFYTFQQLTLLVDLSKGKTHDLRFRDFLLFVIFFPHLIAGPIVHHREMMPQFEKATYRLDWQNMAVGAALFSIGLFKKAVLADGIANHVSPLFADAAAGHPMSLFYAWGAAIGFTLQIYFDFSGYSEMALGLARMVGIKLPMNFNSPLKSASIVEYWSRWHITLTRFLTAYLYNPLAVALSRRRLDKGKGVLAGTRTTPGAFFELVALPSTYTMFLSGLWHGAGYQYLVFGLLHGFYLTVNHAWRLFRPKLWKDHAQYQRVMRPFGIALTFVSVLVAMSFFHAESVPAAWNVVSGMAGANGVALPEFLSGHIPALAALLPRIGVTLAPGGGAEFLALFLWIAALLPIVWLAPNVLEILRDYEPAITAGAPSTPGSKPWILPTLYGALRWTPSPRWAVLGAVLAAGGFLALNQVSEFLYWQF